MFKHEDLFHPNGKYKHLVAKPGEKPTKSSKAKTPSFGKMVTKPETPDVPAAPRRALDFPRYRSETPDNEI